MIAIVALLALADPVPVDPWDVGYPDLIIEDGQCGAGMPRGMLLSEQSYGAVVELGIERNRLAAEVAVMRLVRRQHEEVFRDMTNVAKELNVKLKQQESRNTLRWIGGALLGAAVVGLGAAVLR